MVGNIILLAIFKTFNHKPPPFQPFCIGPNQTNFGPQTVNDMWKWFDSDHYIAASHLSDMFKMSNDHFVQNMSNKRYYSQDEKGRQWVPRRHSDKDSEDLVPEEPPK